MSKDAITDIMTILQNKYNIETFLRVLESWARASLMPFRREAEILTSVLYNVIWAKTGHASGLYL